MVDIVYGALLGVLAGLAFRGVTLFQVKRRTDDYTVVESVSTISVAVLWGLFTALILGVVFWRTQDTLLRVEYLFFISFAINIGVVDIVIRKIPNDSLLALLVVKTVTLVIQMIRGGTFNEVLLPSILGLGVGFVLYLVPSIFNIPIGAGDIKYCGVIGYCLGIIGFLEAAIVMAIGLLLCWAYLVAKKKGSIKSMMTMGPYLSMGVIITIIIPISGYFGTVIG